MEPLDCSHNAIMDATTTIISLEKHYQEAFYFHSVLLLHEKMEWFEV